jgi:minor extracellular serine protease Vpr
MTRRRARPALVFGAAFVVLLLSASTGAGARTVVGGAADESAQSWFVQFASPPTVKGSSSAKLKAERDAFYANAALQGLKVTQRHAFETLWNGVSVSVAAEQAGALASVAGVTAVYPVVPVSLPPVADGGTAEPDLRYAIGMTAADTAQDTLDFDGRGVKVAIMDSGLDYTLPEFGSCAQVGGACRVAGGWDFVGDDYDAATNNSTFQPMPHPDPDPAPCDPNVADARALQPGAGTSSAAHGTHVAGIVGADGRANPADLVTGVAPAATLYAYRVFGCNGSTDADIMAAAMQRAAADKVHVLNMSIGAALNNFPNYPTAVSADNLADAGVVVVASIGNSGDTGLFSAGAPGVANKVIGVASVDNVRTHLPYFTPSPDGRHVGFNLATAAPEPPTSGSLPLVQTGNPTAANDACPSAPALVKDYTAGTFTGRAVLIRRGACGFYNKSLAAQRAGAAAVILYNNAPGRVSPTVAPVAPLTEKITIPVVAITAAEGTLLSERTNAGPTTIKWTDQAEYVDNTDTPGRTSATSSWGTASDLTLKPDIAAPGGNIRSTWPHQQHGGHWVISGTSMASPHVAGAAALYLQGHPGASPTAVRTALQNTAVPITTTVTSTALDSTARQGAGLLNVAAAAEATTVVTPSKLSLGDAAGGLQTLTITNRGTTAKTYELSFVRASSPIAQSISVAVPGGTVSRQSPFTFFTDGNFGIASSSVSFSSPSVTLAPGETKQVAATITPTAAAIERTLYGGYVVLTNAAAPNDRLQVPYVGFKGDYQAIQALGDGGCGMPTLARFGTTTDKIQCTPTRTIDGLIGEPSGGTWAQPKKDPIVVLYHTDHQASNVSLSLLDAATGQPVTQGNRSPVVQAIALHPRNSSAVGFFAFAWDGTLASSKHDSRKAAPGGLYRLKITLTKVKAFNDARAAGTETWTSPALTLRGG